MKTNHRSSVPVLGLKFLLSALVCISFLSARSEAAEPDPSPHKSTNVTVESSSLDASAIDEKTEPKNKQPTYADKNSSIDVSENGEPNLNMRF